MPRTIVYEEADTEQLLKFAEEGRLTKEALAAMLAPEPRGRFLESCASIEKKYTEDCTAKNDPCLESGCSAEGEICLQPLLCAGPEYYKACAAEWARLYTHPENRL
jgi:hypothetical protein